MAELQPAPSGYPIKLVRDKTPDVINSSGEPGELFYEKLTSGVDRKPWLKRKLMEELIEYLTDGSARELLDVVSVMDALVRQHGFLDLNHALREALMDKRGGFLEGVVMYGRHPEFDK